MCEEVHVESLKASRNSESIPVPLVKAIMWNCLIKYDQNEFKTFIWVEWLLLNKKEEISTSQKLFVQVNTCEFQTA